MRIPHVAALALLAAGCARSTVVVRTDGSEVAGTIIESDNMQMLLRDDAGEVIAVPREQIADIDHPGDLGIWLGSFAFGAGVQALVLGGLAYADAEDGSLQGALSAAAMGVGGALVAVGAPLLVVGIIDKGASLRAVEPAAIQITLGPGGLGLRGEF